MNTREQRYSLGIALSLVVLAVSLRLLPHPANFAPVAAIAIFGGSTLPRRLAVWLPVAVMALSDASIGFYSYRIMFVVWGSYLAIALVSSRWLRRPKLKTGAALTVSGSVFFFLSSNFAVWLWGGMYAHSWAGLTQCFWLALPFFRNTFLSDLFYTATLFGLYAYAMRVANKRVTSIRAQVTASK
jgi:hypothetical protein